MFYLTLRTLVVRELWRRQHASAESNDEAGSPNATSDTIDAGHTAIPHNAGLPQPSTPTIS